MKPVPKEGILDMSAYIGGRDAVKGVADPHKMSANENPLGASPAARAALENAFDPSVYPDGHVTALREALANLNRLNAENIVCGNGSDEILQLLTQAYLGPGDEVLHTEHAFLVYKLASRASGASPIAVRERSLTADVDALLGAVTSATRMVFLANPNNPTGTMLGRDEIIRLHAGLSGDTILVLDGAYAEYCDQQNYPAGFDLVEKHNNVVTTRTFSKAYGLAALRLGWGYCPPDVAKVLNRLRGPFNINQSAIAAGLAALDDQGHVEASRAHNAQWREWLVKQLGGIGFSVRPSVANFILVEFDNGKQASAAEAFLCARGVIPRGLTAYGLPHALRLSIGTEAGNRAALDALTDFIAKTDVAEKSG